MAACLAGVFALEDALTLVATRGQLMQAQPGGAMLAVPAAVETVQPFLREPLSLAAINGATQCVSSGPTEAVTVLEEQLPSRELVARGWPPLMRFTPR